MKICICLSLAALFVMVGDRARAESFDTAQSLYELCTLNDAASNSLCMGYLIGVAEMMGANGVLVENGPPWGKNLSGWAICDSGSLTEGQLRQIFINWATKNPQDWGYTGRYGVILALKEQWPCK